MIDVLYHDNHLLAVNKPAGILTQPSGTSQINLEDLAKAWVKEHYNKPGAVFLHAVHRLDKPVSGVVLFARTSKALSRLQEAMRDKNCKKIYEALVEGVLPEEKGTLEHSLLHDDFHATVTADTHPEAKKSRLHYHVLKKEKGLSLLRIELETGRYHQIRAQLAASGCPIVGDQKYGSKRVLGPDQIALHHAELSITHPTKGELLIFKAPSTLSNIN